MSERLQPRPVQPAPKEQKPISVFMPIRSHEQIVELTPGVLAEAIDRGTQRLIPGHEMPILDM